MACSLVTGFSVSSSGENLIQSRTKRTSSWRISTSNVSLQQFNESKDFMGKPLRMSDQKELLNWLELQHNCIHAQASICVIKSLWWWEKALKPNMIEIHYAQELVESLLNASDRLVVVDFYSPGCGGCKALHPKICQLAESNPNAIFLKVNYEELKTMCHSLHIHVLPFFRFYKGAEGKLSSFSCTNATIKKFIDALAKHGTDRCSLGPAKGLDESELLRLASNSQVSKSIMPFLCSSSQNTRMEDDLPVKATNRLGPKAESAILA